MEELSDQHLLNAISFLHRRYDFFMADLTDYNRCGMTNVIQELAEVPPEKRPRMVFRDLEFLIREAESRELDWKEWVSRAKSRK